MTHARLKTPAQTKAYESAISDCSACLNLDSSYFKAYRTRARAHLAQEDFEASVRDFKQAYELAPAGSNDEAALKREVRDAEAALKKSKMKDHYKTLGITSSATEVEIKKAYRKMSLVHHPDKGGDEAVFKEVSLALGAPEKEARVELTHLGRPPPPQIGESYAILSDPQRRAKFDAGIDEVSSPSPLSAISPPIADSPAPAIARRTTPQAACPTTTVSAAASAAEGWAAGSRWMTFSTAGSAAAAAALEAGSAAVGAGSEGIPVLGLEVEGTRTGSERSKRAALTMFLHVYTHSLSLRIASPPRAQLYHLLLSRRRARVSLQG